MNLRILSQQEFLPFDNPFPHSAERNLSGQPVAHDDLDGPVHPAFSRIVKNVPSIPSRVFYLTTVAIRALTGIFAELSPGDCPCRSNFTLTFGLKIRQWVDPPKWNIPS